MDIRLTRSTSGSILDIDFVGGPAMSTMPPPAAPGCSTAVALSAASGAALLGGSGRKLKILEHRVHKVENRTKENGEQEEELVVSNLRPFTLKVGVLDVHDQPLLDGNLPLRATLLYENGLPVKQTSSSEPLLVGETDVVALQGAATFKLRITSLSSHRDKQRFRIQIEPQARAAQLGRATRRNLPQIADASPPLTLLQEMHARQLEPQLVVVTDPMKSVTKLGRASGAANGAAPLPPTPDADGGAASESLKRKYRETLELHSAQIAQMQETQQLILQEIRSVAALAQQALGSKGKK